MRWSRRCTWKYARAKHPKVVNFWPFWTPSGDRVGESRLEDRHSCQQGKAGAGLPSSVCLIISGFGRDLIRVWLHIHHLPGVRGCVGPCSAAERRAGTSLCCLRGCLRGHLHGRRARLVSDSSLPTYVVKPRSEPAIVLFLRLSVAPFGQQDAVAAGVLL